MKIHNVFYKVKITKCVAEHTCQLSTQFYDRAMITSSREQKISASRMQTLVYVLKNRPSICARDLRPIIAEFVKVDQPLDYYFIQNFRQRIAYFIAKNPNFGEITQEEADQICSPINITQEEHQVLDNPIIFTNFRDILRKVMSEDSSTWEALAYARQ